MVRLHAYVPLWPWQGLEEHAESYTNAIQAWCASKNNESVFTTGHFWWRTAQPIHQETWIPYAKCQELKPERTQTCKPPDLQQCQTKQQTSETFVV